MRNRKSSNTFHGLMDLKLNFETMIQHANHFIYWVLVQTMSSSPTLGVKDRSVTSDQSLSAQLISMACCCCEENRMMKEYKVCLLP